MMPISHSKIKGNPFEVVCEIDGVRTAVLADQIKSLDYQVRKAKIKSKISTRDPGEMRAKIEPLLQIG